jgi:hypothetical protein
MKRTSIEAIGLVLQHTTPPQRQPLTEEEIDAIWDEEKVFANPYEIARAIERKHGIGGKHD